MLTKTNTSTRMQVTINKEDKKLADQFAQKNYRMTYNQFVATLATRIAKEEKEEKEEKEVSSEIQKEINDVVSGKANLIESDNKESFLRALGF